MIIKVKEHTFDKCIMERTRDTFVWNLYGENYENELLPEVLAHVVAVKRVSPSVMSFRLSTGSYHSNWYSESVKNKIMDFELKVGEAQGAKRALILHEGLSNLLGVEISLGTELKEYVKRR